MGRYAAYTERTITVETGLAIALGDGAAYRRLRMRVVVTYPHVLRRRLGRPKPDWALSGRDRLQPVLHWWDLAGALEPGDDIGGEIVGRAG